MKSLCEIFDKVFDEYKCNVVIFHSVASFRNEMFEKFWNIQVLWYIWNLTFDVFYFPGASRNIKRSDFSVNFMKSKERKYVLMNTFILRKSHNVLTNF